MSTRRTLVIAATLFVAMTGSAAGTERSQVPIQYRWDLTALFKNEAE